MKSKIILLLCILLLVNAALMFRAGVNTLFFAVDTSDEYAPVQVRVEELQPADPEAGKGTPVIPVCSFEYKGKSITMPAPGLMHGGRTLQKGREYTVWLHPKRGELIWPPVAGQKEVGRSQMVISVISLLLAILVWVFCSRGVKKQ